MNTEHYKEPKQPMYVEDDEITLRELILKLREFWWEILRYWWVLVLLAAIGAAVLAVRIYLKESVYKADMTFMMNTEESRNNLGGLLGQFGFTGSSSGVSLDKIVKLSQSMRIVQSVLMRRAEINGKEDFFANHLLDAYNYQELWKDSYLNGFYFTHDSIPAFSLLENRALKALYVRMVGNSNIDPVVRTSYDKLTNVLTITAESPSEELSLALVDAMYDVLEKFYVRQTIQPQQQTYNKIKTRVDSLRERLTSLEFSLANFNDSSYGTYAASSQVQRSRLQRDLNITAVAYGEAIKNMEIASFSMDNAKPIFQVIDRPFPPLSASKGSLLIAIVLGSIVGIILGIVLVVSRKVFRDVMQEA